MFIEQQVEDDQEVKSILMDKLQKSCLWYGKMLNI
jgi:hypothetical protein